MANPLLMTKLNMPRLRPDRVARQQLTSRLETAATTGHKLILVSAPAGFGKTTLVVSWLESRDHRSAWLTLNESDNDPVRFMSYLVASLQAVHPDIGQDIGTLLQSSQPASHETLLTPLINDLASFDQSIILVLDDYHAIHNLSIHKLLAFFLENQPKNVCMVISTREDPALPLARLRGRAEMEEIRQEDIQFSSDETEIFLREVMDLSITIEDCAVLHDYTEGWITGLQMAAISLHDHADTHQFVTSFTGSNRYILDYLIDEVFARQNADVKDFLVRTSYLELLTGSLCDAITGRDDSRRLLNRLEHDNLFLIPLDESRSWYRYHHLFADLLRQRARIHLRDQVVDLHKRAGQWFEENGYEEEAVGHLIAAKEWDKAAQLIGSCIEKLMKRGEIVTLLTWFGKLPVEVIKADPRLCLGYAWQLILAEQFDTAREFLEPAKSYAAKHEDTELQGETAAADAFISRARGDVEQAVELSKQALRQLPAGDHTGRAAVAVNLGITQWFRGQLAEAEQALHEAQVSGHRSGNDYAGFSAQIFLSRIQQARGDLRNAVSMGREIVHHASGKSFAAPAYYDLGRIFYEWNELDSAEHEVRVGIELAQKGCSADFLCGGFSTLAVIHQAQGRIKAANAALRKAESHLEHPGISTATRLACLNNQIMVAVSQGDERLLSGLVNRFPGVEQTNSFPDTLNFFFYKARYSLLAGKLESATETLNNLYTLASESGFVINVIKTLSFQSILDPAIERSIETLAEALRMANNGNFIRTFLDLGEPMAEKLRIAAQKGIESVYSERLLREFRKERNIWESHSSHPAMTVSDHVDQSRGLIEPLSEREIEVLRLLAAGLSNREIGKHLVISTGTVKTHVHNIYGKLEVQNRAQAIVLARDKHLV